MHVGKVSFANVSVLNGHSKIIDLKINKPTPPTGGLILYLHEIVLIENEQAQDMLR